MVSDGGRDMDIDILGNRSGGGNDINLSGSAEDRTGLVGL
jgi:hypothetical protein